MSAVVWATIKAKELHVGNDVRAGEQGVASRVLAIHRSREGTYLIRSRLQSFLLKPDDPIEVALEGGEDEVFDCPHCGDGDALREGEECAYCGEGRRR